MFVLLLSVDGQKIAERLSSSIGKETATARKILVDYNATVFSVTGDSSQYMLQEVLCPDSEFWNVQHPPTVAPPTLNDPNTPWDAKDIIQAYLLVKRSQEELSLLAEEKHNTLAYWTQRKVNINQHICTLERSST